MKYQFSVTKTTNPKAKPDPDTLGFGAQFTDHMFLLDYKEGKGWHNGRIVPYGPIELDPAALVFHYGQEMFEGLKAYKDPNGKVVLFRPDKNVERTNNTNKRMCIPEIEKDLMIEAIKAVVEIDKDWIPEKEGTALYVRPFIIATEPCLSVRPSKEFLLAVILSPVGPYYKEGMAPTKIYVEQDFIRAVKGGTGFAKIGGNYAGALLSQEVAHEEGYSQVLWLDGVEKKYVEEIGTSNAFFVIDNEVITAPLEGTILPGITRDSVITLLKSWGVTVREERLAIADLWKYYEQGRVQEIFATGTAAVISPVGELKWLDHVMNINNGEIGPVSQRLYDEITGIQLGKMEDKFGWVVHVD